MTTHTSQYHVYAPKWAGFTFNQLAERPDEAVRFLNITKSDLSDSTDYTLVGVAVVEIHFLPESSVVDNRIARLRREREDVQAEAQQKITNIEREIQSLLAIEG